MTYRDLTHQQETAIMARAGHAPHARVFSRPLTRGDRGSTMFNRRTRRRAEHPRSGRTAGLSSPPAASSSPEVEDEHLSESLRQRDRLVTIRVLVGSGQAAHAWMSTHGLNAAARQRVVVVNSLESIRRKALAAHNPLELSVIKLHDADPFAVAALDRLTGTVPVR